MIRNRPIDLLPAQMFGLSRAQPFISVRVLLSCSILLMASLMHSNLQANALAVHQADSGSSPESHQSASLQPVAPAVAASQGHSPVPADPAIPTNSSETSSPSSDNTSGSSGRKPTSIHHHTSSSRRHHSSSAAAAATRQSPASFATSLIGALGNMVPGLITNVVPLMMLFGLGALMMPALGLNAASLSRESRPSIPEQFGTAQTASWPTFYYPNLQQTLFAAAQQQQQHQAQRPHQGMAQDYYYLTKRSIDSGPASESQINWPSSGQIANTLQTLLEHVTRALDNSDKQYQSLNNNNQKH